MKKTIRLVLMLLVITVFSGCTLFQNLVATKTTTPGEPQTVITTPGSTADTVPGTLPSTTGIATDPSTTPVTITPATTVPKTKPVTKPPTTKPPTTKPLTKPLKTIPHTTKPLFTKPLTKPFTKPLITIPPATKPAIVKSNLPKDIKAALDKSANGFILIYKPQNYKNIVAITAWDVTTFNTNSQLFLVTKKKNSVVKVYDTKLTSDLQDRVINDVIRDWKTTEDYEVIRIRYSDPETLTMNFIKVIEPGGKKTITDIKSSMVGLPEWEAFAYD